MKKSFVESGLDIEISGEIIIRFDKHKYYKHFSGTGFKGVDFLVVNDDYLYLIEIKNYQQYEQTKRPDEEKLYRLFTQKCEDTLEIIEKFYSYLNDNWLRNLLFLKWKWYFLGSKEWKEWVKIYETYKSGQVICLLETC